MPRTLACDILMWSYDVIGQGVAVDLDEGAFMNGGNKRKGANAACYKPEDDHSKGCTQKDHYAQRDIRAGEEIVDDYSMYEKEETHPAETRWFGRMHKQLFADMRVADRREHQRARARTEERRRRSRENQLAQEEKRAKRLAALNAVCATRPVKLPPRPAPAESAYFAARATWELHGLSSHATAEMWGRYQRSGAAPWRCKKTAPASVWYPSLGRALRGLVATEDIRACEAVCVLPTRSALSEFSVGNSSIARLGAASEGRLRRLRRSMQQGDRMAMQSRELERASTALLVVLGTPRRSISAGSGPCPMTMAYPRHTRRPHGRWDPPLLCYAVCSVCG